MAEEIPRLTQTMRFSIILPSYNQPGFIEATLQNVRSIKEKAPSKGCEVEVLLFDSCSDEAVQEILQRYKPYIDHLEIAKDKGQYDAINKGIQKLSGDYWTWLNTDDLLDEQGFFRITEIVKQDPAIGYIYGNIDVIDEQAKLIRSSVAPPLDLERLLNRDAGIWQPGSFFKKTLTDKTGLLSPYNCCFDYEYILRILKNGAKFHACDFRVAMFRMHGGSKSGSIVKQFIREQMEISKRFGRRSFSYLSILFFLRKIKKSLLN